MLFLAMERRFILVLKERYLTTLAARNRQITFHHGYRNLACGYLDCETAPQKQSVL
jgi:hypothetical protein